MKSDKTTSTESNTNEADNYSEIRTAEDAQNVEVGDTLSVEINAYAERDDRDEAFHAPQLIDGYELDVTDISEGELVAGGRVVTITISDGDEITITSDGVRELKRDYEYYSNRDRHNPENRVRIDLLADSDDEPEVVTDEKELDDLICDNYPECHQVVFNAAYDVQRDLQNHLDLGYEEVQVIGSREDYIVVANESLWSETETGFRTDVWSNNTTEAIFESVRDLHIDLAERAMDKDDLRGIRGVTDVAVVFTR